MFLNSNLNNNFRKLKEIIPVFNVGTTAISKVINGDCTIHIVTGTSWINPNTVATTANGGKLGADKVIDMNAGTISFISDSTGASVQIFVWE